MVILLSSEMEMGANSITFTSTGGCADRNNPNCTSLEGVFSGTVGTAITFKGYNGCSSLVITGSTETRHGSVSGKPRWNGYKINLSHMLYLDN
ncbi:hypothetical protein BGZ82_005530 [Podila clonocystis]|nr:hypothetical protein BGZ82_005530 [Podila clonocystis]